ncbi:hypothetical protein F5X68DRAFT_264819 [Plectosphaerella plurivora]|uniref:Uncharacterized protein n=1 Tax=Plectosphaerella plurivora TaxID=936078 RepID=A0A9P8V4A6_9PEZI|nr:hypothetical protein F5X68DRAFT_264819 [Plectosphaerella plurivora]
MSAEPKTQVQTSDFEVDSPRMASYNKLRMLDAVDGAGTALTVLALCAGVTVLALSADALSVYQATHAPAASLLPLWPDEFDLRPTVALVACGAIIVCANAASMLGSRMRLIRQTPLLNAGLSLLAPGTGLVAAVVAVALFYAANTSSSTDTLESWSCRWRTVYMTARPHFGTLCKQSHAAAYLSILLIPVEVAALGVAGWRAVLERNTDVEFVPRQEKRTGSAAGSAPSSRGGN